MQTEGMEPNSLLLLPPPPSHDPYPSLYDISARSSATRVALDDMDTPPEPPTPAPEPEEQVVLQEEQQLAEPPIPQTPQTALTFLLVSGRRRTMSFDPDTTVGRVKELVWNAWPNGASASSLHRD